MAYSPNPKLWDVAWDQWQHRNGILHDKEASMQQSLEGEKIKEQYILGPAGLTKDGAIMLKTRLERTLALSPAIRTAWLIRVTASRDRKSRSREASARSNRQERAVMARWLHGSNQHR